MARKRYDGLKALLGASLTNSGTTITFSAALTYLGSSAVAVPTLGASDYIALGLLDANGVVCETVWLTAYTSGNTTGTIVRGKEGSTGVAHSSGDKVVCAVTARDLCFAGSRVDNPDDALWGADLGYDLEFEADDTSGSLPSGFSWHNQGGAAFKQQWGAGILSIPGSTSDSLRSACRSVSGFPSAWTAKAKVSLATDNGPYTSVGLMIRNAGGKSYTINKTGGDNGIAVTAWNSDTSFNANLVNSVMSEYGAQHYLGIRFNSSTSVDFLWSPDGVVWKTMFNLNPTSFLTTITEVGFFASNTSTSQAFDAAVKWFRVR